jgi:hypothetical protein
VVRGRAGLHGARRDLGQAGRDARRASANLYEAGRSVVGAGGAGMAAARDVVGDAASQAGQRVGDVAEKATERVTQVAETARDRASELAVGAGRSAVGVGSQILGLPELVREGARRGRETIETTSARAVVSVIDTGAKRCSTPPRST